MFGPAQPLHRFDTMFGTDETPGGEGVDFGLAEDEEEQDTDEDLICDRIAGSGAKFRARRPAPDRCRDQPSA
ncbi:MAG: hypothetical protein HKN98_13885 [Silicimonas sp.]|nr:hypothetical protein [Silicimonas sp.]